MAISVTPRSVSDATRFTQTTPHATSKPASSSRFQPPSGSQRQQPRQTPPPAFHGETPEQRVARLRAAHVAARNAQVSVFDRVVAGGRTVFDKAHRITVTGLIGFSLIGGLLTIYTAVDMLRYNRKRKNEFLTAQRAMEADSLEAARLAYMRGDANDEQIALVDYMNERARSGGFKMPNILAPATADTAAAQRADTETETEEAGKGGLTGWLYSDLKKEEVRQETGRRRAGDVEGKGESIGDRARAAFEQEKQNQQKGGPLDRVGLDGEAKGSKSKTWWPFR